jgi:prolyl-tRNA synthetase
MFADLELIGIPHRLVVSERTLKQGEAEYRGRSDSESRNIALRDVAEFLKSKTC